MTLKSKERLVKGMKLSEKQMERLVRFVFNDLKGKNIIQFKDKEEKVFDRALALVKAEFQKEIDLDAEVHRMMDQLEQQNAGEFERYKMFPLLKKKLAKDKGIIL